VKKLIKGIVEFRQKVRKEYNATFGGLAKGQSPDALFIACSDSRVQPNTFASTEPGDVFVLRNVGNLIPPCGKNGISNSDKAEAAAIEFAIINLNVKYIIVCGHSECGAMHALANDREKVQLPNLKRWLRHGDLAVEQLKNGETLDNTISEANQLSQLNVLLQIENIKSYPAVKKRLDEGKLSIQGWWFDIAKADVYAYEEDIKRFVLIDEVEAERLIKRLHEGDV